MQIDVDLLLAFGAVIKNYQKEEMIFYENETALFYYQIINGAVKMYYTNDDGKDHIQGFFYTGSSFGEPPLLIDEAYPSNAIAIEDSTILKICKDKFTSLLQQNSEICFSFMKLLSLKALTKINTSKHIINQKPEYRIISFLEEFKKRNNCVHSEKKLIPYTRQEIADFTGLRVETVIRTLSQMKRNGKVKIIQHKLYF